jgi:hypothetical protein
MKKSLLAIGLVLCLGSFAAAAKPTVYNFGLNGFCDTFSLVLYTPGAPIPKVMVGGTHSATACSFPTLNVGGNKHGVSPLISGAKGSALDFSDSEYATWYGEVDNAEWFVNTTAGTWAVYDGDGTGNYLINSGTTSADVQSHVTGKKSATAR